MMRLSRALTRAQYMAFIGLVLAAAAIGLADRHPEQAAVGWLLVALVALICVLWPRFLVGLPAGVGAANIFALIASARVSIDGGGWRPAAISMIVSAVALIVLPVLLMPILKGVRRLAREGDDAKRRMETLALAGERPEAQRPPDIGAILDEEIERSRRYNRDLTFCLISIDNWPAMVVKHGEAAMRQTAGKLEQTLRARQRNLDTIVDLGAGEIALVLPETPLEGAEVVAGRIQSQIGPQCAVPLRVSIIDVTDAAMTRESLLREARSALEFGRVADLPIVDRTILAGR